MGHRALPLFPQDHGAAISIGHEPTSPGVPQAVSDATGGGPGDRRDHAGSGAARRRRVARQVPGARRRRPHRGHGEILAARANGAGKTTLLRLIGGVALERTGRVLGHDLATAAPPCAEVGMLGHRNGLYLDLTVTENALLGRWSEPATTRSPPRAARPRRPSRPPAVPGCPPGRSGVLRSPPSRAPGAAVAARRTAQRPRRRRRDDLDALVRQAVAAGATVVIASHDLDRVDALATRVVTVAGGTVTTSDADPSRSGHRIQPKTTGSGDQNDGGLPS